MLLSLLRHGQCRIGQLLLPWRTFIIRESPPLLEAGRIDVPLAPQEIQHAPADAVHGKEAERHASPMVVVLHGLDEADRAFLHDIHDTLILPEWQGLLEDQRLIGLDEPPPIYYIIRYEKSFLYF